jgi:predicted outer membrane repeat protein
MAINMIGELIPTGVTFGTGRISINNQFSGTAEFNSIEVSGNLSAGTGGAFYSGGTDLYNIFSTNNGRENATIDPYVNLGTTGLTTINWDVSGSSTNYEVILSGDVSLTITNVRNGEYGTIIVTQDSYGGRNLTFGSGNNKVVNGGSGAPTLTSAPNATDILSFTYNGSTMYWTVGNDYT